jgi:hypothetical protein
MDAALSTLKRECAEQGLDKEEVLRPRAAGIHLLEELGAESAGLDRSSGGGDACGTARIASAVVEEVALPLGEGVRGGATYGDSPATTEESPATPLVLISRLHNDGRR